MTDKIANHTLVLLKYHEMHPEVSYQHLGELFGVTRQRVSQIIKRYRRDHMAVEYLRTHPEASIVEIRAIFEIRSSRRIRALMQEAQRHLFEE